MTTLSTHSAPGQSDDAVRLFPRPRLSAGKLFVFGVVILIGVAVGVFLGFFIALVSGLISIEC